jgi:hypothetical protein
MPPFFSAMLERWITALHTEDPGLEEPTATRDRFKDRFPKNATRRMTQLGLLVGSTLKPIGPTENDTLVYASAYAETRAIEGYLDSFPGASPTLFQTSIHPSAVQQALIIQQQAVRQFFPLTGGAFLPAQALQVAMLAETPRTILCGGEERGTWLLENNSASDRAFAFALALSSSADGALARLTLDDLPDNSHADSRFTLPDLFDVLHKRRSFSGWIAPSRRLTLAWI